MCVLILILFLLTVFDTLQALFMVEDHLADGVNEVAELADLLLGLGELPARSRAIIDYRGPVGATSQKYSTAERGHELRRTKHHVSICP